MARPLSRPVRRSGPGLLAAFAAVSLVSVWFVPAARAAPAGVTAEVETAPVLSSGDAADDPAIWRHPTDPSRSLVIGNDKGGSLDVYDLNGTRLQRITDGGAFFGNVDVRTGFPLAGGTVDVAAVSRGGLRLYRIDPASRQLANVTDGGSVRTSGGEGLCLYRSPVSGRFYAFHIARLTGGIEQYELGDADGDGLIDGRRVRAWALGSEAEGCVADDELGAFYVSQEDVGIWRYGAEPDDPTTTRTSVDTVGAGGHLAADVEGLTIVDQPGDSGYLLASSQGDDRFVVYERSGANAFLGDFRVINGDAVDGCSSTDGIAALAADLGPAFPHGLFVCQDGRNTLPGTAGNQDFKLVRLERLVALDAAPPPPNRIAAFDADADARLASGNPDLNYGTTTSLGADTSPPLESVLRFSPSDLDGPVQQATLRLFATGGTGDGPEVYGSDGGWSETTVSWNTRPARTSGVLDDAGPVAAGTFVDLDVTALVTGNGTYSFTLVADSGDGATFRSREALGDRPLLLVTTGPPGPDTTPPETTIASGPSGTVSTDTATFAFTADESGSTFECSLDTEPFAACTSPRTATALADGPHSFQVRATDPAGNTDPTPAGRSFTVDTSAPPTPAIGFRAATADGSPTARTAITIALPIGTQAGDVMLASIVSNDDDPAFTAPPGWTLVGQDTVRNLLRQAIYVKVADAAEPAAYTWTTSTQRRLAGGITSYTGVDSASPVDTHAIVVSTVASTTITAPSITTQVDGDLLVFFAAVNAEGTIAPPGGMTERWEAAAPRAGSTRDATAAGADEPLPLAGATGPRTATASQAGRSIAALVALQPAG